MSPRWGFKTFGYPVCYKHVAPLGLKTGNMSPSPLYILALRWGANNQCRRYYRHFRSSGAEHCYKHVAPLGIKTSGSHPLYTLRSSGARTINVSLL